MRAFAFCFVLIVGFCLRAGGAISYILDAPLDDSDVRMLVADRVDVRQLNREWNKLQEAFLWPLRSSDVAKKFGPKFKKLPDAHVLPVFEGNLVTASGLMGQSPNRRHVDVYPLGDIGYVELYFHYDGEMMETAVLYFRPDVQFVPLKSKADIPKRLAWEKQKFAIAKTWLRANLSDHTAEVRRQAIEDARKRRADELRVRGFDSGVCPIHHVPLQRCAIYTWSHGSDTRPAERYPPLRLYEKYPMSTLSYFERLTPSADYQRRIIETICPECQRLFEAETRR